MLGPNAVMQSPNGLAARFEHEGEVCDEPHSIPSFSRPDHCEIPKIEACSSNNCEHAK